jgi:hypothetical protein
MSDSEKLEAAFRDFKESFFYGDRSNLNFKWLAHLEDSQAADFFQDLLEGIGAALDDDNFQNVVDIVTRWQAEGYRIQRDFDYDSGPFVRLEKSLVEARLTLLTSSGHFVDGDDPKPFGVENMSQAEAERRVLDFLKEQPVLSQIPMDIPAQNLRVRHGGYDIHGALADPNTAFPLYRLQEIADQGVIGGLSPLAYSFVGACSQKRLLKKDGLDWVERIKTQQTDAVLLVPV